MEFISGQSSFLRVFRRIALVTVAALGILTGCTQSPPKSISPTESKLELRMSEFENGEISLTREDKGTYIIEIGRWKSSDGLTGAVLVLHQFKPIVSQEVGFLASTPEKMIKAFFEGRTVTLGTKRMTRNSIGPVELQKFTLNDFPCVFVQTGYENMSEFTPDDMLGTTTVRGWFCRQSLDRATINEFIWSIHVKGIPVR